MLSFHLRAETSFTHMTTHTQMADAQSGFCHRMKIVSLFCLIFCLIYHHVCHQNFIQVIALSLSFISALLLSFVSILSLSPLLIHLFSFLIPLHPASEGRGRYWHVRAGLYWMCGHGDFAWRRPSLLFFVNFLLLSICFLAPPHLLSFTVWLQVQHTLVK